MCVLPRNFIPHLCVPSFSHSLSVSLSLSRCLSLCFSLCLSLSLSLSLPLSLSQSLFRQRPPKADPSGYWRSHAGRANRRLHVRYDQVPSTVFTPLEYSMCGWSEEQAARELGGAVRVFHSYFQPLEWSLPQRGENTGFVKVVCDPADGDRVVGLHYVGPNAAEVMQGFSVAMQSVLPLPPSVVLLLAALLLCPLMVAVVVWSGARRRGW